MRGASGLVGIILAFMLAACAVNMMAVALKNIAPFLPYIIAAIVGGLIVAEIIWRRRQW